MARPRLALVPGEPAGVGPELCVRAAQRTWNADLVAYGDGRSLLDASDRLGLPLQLVPPDTAHVAPGQLRLVEIANAASCRPGTPDPRNAAAVIAALSRAADDCLAGCCQAWSPAPCTRPPSSPAARLYRHHRAARRARRLRGGDDAGHDIVRRPGHPPAAARGG